jgi:hypothetical protein
MWTEILAAIPIAEIAALLIATVTAAVGAVARRYLGERTAALAMQAFDDAAQRALALAITKAGLPLGTPVPSGMREQIVQTGAEYLQRTKADAIKTLGASAAQVREGLRARLAE